MPHRLSRSETSTRLLIATLLGARPAMTRRDLAAFFHVSLRTVIDAVRHPVSRWVDLLAASPEPSNPGRSRFSPSRRQKPVLVKRPGSRSRARLAESEPTVEYEEQVDFDEAVPEVDDDAMDRAACDADDALDRKLRGLDDQ